MVFFTREGFDTESLALSRQQFTCTAPSIRLEQVKPNCSRTSDVYGDSVRINFLPQVSFVDRPVRDPDVPPATVHNASMKLSGVRVPAPEESFALTAIAAPRKRFMRRCVASSVSYFAHINTSKVVLRSGEKESYTNV